MSPEHGDSPDQTGRTAASWVIAPTRRSTGDVLWEIIGDARDLAAIRSWGSSASQSRTGGSGRPDRDGTSASGAISVPGVASVSGSTPGRRHRRAAGFPARALHGLRRLIQGWGLRPLLHASVRLDVGGLEEVQNLTEPAILAANHASHLDAVAVLTALPSRQRSGTAVGIPPTWSSTSGWRAIVAAVVFQTVRHPTPKSGPSNRKLRAGSNVLAFPEGTRSPDGFIESFGTDTAQLAIDDDRPVTPVGIRGSYAAMPRGQSWPTAGRPRVAVRFGPELWPHRGESAAHLTGRIRTEVDRLITEDITSWWQAQADPWAGAESGAPAGTWRRRWQQSRSAEPGKTAPPRRIWKR